MSRVIMMPTSRIVHSDPDILGGTTVFVGTRVPIKTLLDYLEAGGCYETGRVAFALLELPV